MRTRPLRAPIRPALNRLALAGLLAASAVAGLLFAPVFGLAPLLVPVVIVVLAGYGCVELAARWPVLVPWRPVLTLLAGLLGLTESVLFPSTVAGLPTGSTLVLVWHGFSAGWLRTLQSTWPARPDPDQLLFVPLAVLLVVIVGGELWVRLRGPLSALLPSLAMAGLAQLYQALTGFGALLAVAGYAAAAGVLLWADRPSRQDATNRAPGGLRTGRRLTVAGASLAGAVVVAVLAGAVLVGGLDPVGREPYRLSAGPPPESPQALISNPLNEIAARLGSPDQEVFRYRGDAPVDRWRLAVLGGFDGANWSDDGRLQRFGLNRDAAPGSLTRSADVRLTGLSGPWLPSQPTPLGVDGVAPLVNQQAGTLLAEHPAGPSTGYRLTWSVPQVDPRTLGVAPVDTQAPGGFGDLGAVPPGMDQLAKQAVLGLRPTFQSALQLERFLSRNYQVVEDGTVPTGHGWPQLKFFLTDSKRGSSEQFAAAYVVLARLSGIPARLAVGFHGAAASSDGFTVVHNRDVLAWPEVAVAGVGWVPLDPTAQATKARTPLGSGDLAGAAARARDQLPPENSLRPPELPPRPARSGFDFGVHLGPGTWVLITVAGLGVLLVGWLLGVPLAKTVRARRRRRRSGAEGVIGAWAEARDQLRAHGVPYRIGMTPRDLAESAVALVGAGTVAPIIRLAKVVDMALWSGVPVSGGAVRQAWEEVGAVRRGLAVRPWSVRFRAAVEPRTLLPLPARGPA